MKPLGRVPLRVPPSLWRACEPVPPVALRPRVSAGTLGGLPVDLAAMADLHNGDDAPFVIDLVQDAIHALPNPVLLSARAWMRDITRPKSALARSFSSLTAERRNSTA